MAEPPTDDVLTEKIAKKALRDFFREKPFVFIGTGLSCALDSRFGMPALRDVLFDKLQSVKSFSKEQQKEWSSVQQALDKGSGLENALDNVADEGLLECITKATGDFIAGLDREHCLQLASNASEWPGTPMVQRLLNAMSEGDGALHVLTPNYDMLFEYACEAANITYSDGYVGGVEKVLNWRAVIRLLSPPQKRVVRNKARNISKPAKHIRLYKVHGSLNYFFHRGRVAAIDAWMWNPPDDAKRIMITPGLSKYEVLQHYRRELLKSADNAIEGSSRFLFIGYGFNDSHLEEYIKRKLVDQKCQGLIITRSANPSIHALLEQADNLWLVSQIDDGTSENSQIYNKRYGTAYSVENRQLWVMTEFITYALGG